MKILRYWITCILLMPFYTVAGQNIILPLPDSNLNLIANYQAGDKDKPVIILLHGFLQTKDFSTVQQLSNGLINEGYSILQPTISLGINQRKKSLACEAIHTHKINDGSKELRQWVLWLKKQGHKQIVGLGHSFGSLRFVAYQADPNNPPLQSLILTSLIYTGGVVDLATWQALANKARQAQIANQVSPAAYKLGFCAKYITLPSAFLSYYQFDEKHITNIISHVKIPIHIIIGSDDQRINMDWVTGLRSAQIKIKIIDGADHFFDAEHEFDVQDAILDSLNIFNY